MPASKGRWWLTHDSQQIVINTRPGRVYGLVSDLPRMGQWSPECERVEWADGSTVAAEGARFVGHNRGGPFRLMRWSRRGRVLAADAGREFAFATEEGGRESTLWRYRFEPVEGGTRVTESYQVRWIPAWARMLDILTNRHRELREAMGHTLGQLKTAAEAPAGSPGSHDDAAEPALRPDAVTGLTVQRPNQPGRRSPMSTEHPAAPAPIALRPTEGEALWFMGFLATIKATADGTAGRVAVIHHLGPQDAGSPLHVHHREDEWFYVLAGELTVWVGGQVIRAPAGSFVFGPQGTPHTFTVSSPDGASFLLVTEPGGFEAFMRTCAESARSLTLPPPPDSPPTRHSSPPSPPNTASK